jgi:chemotaxis protein MotA
MAATPKRRRIDSGTLAGLTVAVAGILGGYLLEGGKAGDVLGESAALIVFGGCLGATLVANPLPLVKAAFARTRDLLFELPDDKAELIDQLVAFSQAARKNGIVSLEQDAEGHRGSVPAQKHALAVDGTDLQEIRKIMELARSPCRGHRAEARPRCSSPPAATRPPSASSGPYSASSRS